MVPHGFGILLLSSVDTDLMVLFLPVSFLRGSQQMALPLLRLQQMAECPFGILLLELDNCKGRPRLSISRIHADKVDSSVFDNFWQLAFFSAREATPPIRRRRVVRGTSKAKDADWRVLNWPFL